MADSKITALASIGTGTDPANDPLVIVDVSDVSPGGMSATGTTKKVTLNNLLSSSPTASGNFTITGDLTVGTSALKVFPATNRVLINQSAAIFGDPLEISALSTSAALSLFGRASDNLSSIAFRANNSTTEKVRFYGGNNGLEIATAGTVRATIDTSGNLGLGVTPSAWGAGYKVIQSQIGGFALSNDNSSNNQFRLSSNAYNNGTNWIYYGSSTATTYEQRSGEHRWYNAPSGTAGNAITFTQAMTLDASGNLLVGTANSASNAGIGLKAAYSATAPYFATVGSSNASNVYSYLLYSTGDAAFKFYVSYSGTISAVSNTISAISDARLKENVQDIDVGLDAILALKPRKFDWKAGKGKNIKGDRGFIAQEFETVFPNLIDEWKDPAPEGEAPYKSVRQDLIPVLVKAIQQLTDRIVALENK